MSDRALRILNEEIPVSYTHLEQTARSDITFFQKMGFHQKIKFINKNAINKNVINKTSSTILNNTYADESENVSGSVLENYKINSIYGIKNYSYIIKVSGSRRGIGVTHTVLSMAPVSYTHLDVYKRQVC